MARTSRITVVKWVPSDIRIEAHGDGPPRLYATAVGQDKAGNTVTTETLNVEVTQGDVPPAVRQAVETIVTFVAAWAKDG